MTTLTATRYVDPTTGLIGVKLNVTGAAAPPATLYASNFSSTTDGWSIVSGTGTLVTSPTWAGALQLAAASGTDNVQAGRTITGLTIGQTYRFTVDVERDAGQVTAVVTNLGGTGYQTTLSGGFTTLTLDFTATATSHQIKVAIQRSGGTWSATPQYNFKNAKVYGPVGSWSGLKVYRTDNNTDGQRVRNPGNVDTVGGTATLYDWEPALNGTVYYSVLDGAGNYANVPATRYGLDTDSAWITLPAKASTASPYTPPSMDLFKVTAWEETQGSIGRTHQIIGRTDKVGNPGPLAMRTGSFDVLGLTYAAVEELRTLIGAGDVALLRQPTHHGLDLYFTVTDLRARFDTDSQTWTATVGYEEVPRP